MHPGARPSLLVACTLTLLACGSDPAPVPLPTGQPADGASDESTQTEQSPATGGMDGAGAPGASDGSGPDDPGAPPVSDPGQAPDDPSATPATDAGDSAGPDGGSGPATPAARCNGHEALCERRFNEVVLPTTHNSHSAEDLGYSGLAANQVHSLERQLADGVRGLLMDVYDEGGVVTLCHSVCALGNQPHREALATLFTFLRENPREVVAIIYQDDVPPAAIEEDFVATGLDAFTFTHEPSTPWPTLAEMIDSGQRLVVTLERGRPPPSWLHHVWDEAWDTPYSFNNPGDFSCELNRGSSDNALFLLNHWLNTVVGLPDKGRAAETNSFDVLHGRAVQCMEESGQLPNFVAVDWYEQGDLFEVVDALNGV